MRHGGDGDWVVAGIIVAAELQRKQLRGLAWVGPDLDIATHIVGHKDKWMSPGMAAFLELLPEKLQA